MLLNQKENDIANKNNLLITVKEQKNSIVNCTLTVSSKGNYGLVFDANQR